jgi:hypothetical protein
MLIRNSTLAAYLVVITLSSGTEDRRFEYRHG